MQSHLWFFRLYLGHFLIYPTAWFHEEMFAISEDTTWKLAVIMGFPSSGKSTILNTSFILWAVLGKLEKKFIVIASHNRYKAQSHLERIKYELCNNEMLKNDFGNYLKMNSTQSKNYLEIPHYGVKIMAISAYQNFRSLRNGLVPPDLVICDDIEDPTIQRQTKETVNDWFRREILANIHEKTKVVVLGNLFNRNSLLLELKKIIDTEVAKGVFRAYPLLDDQEQILWPEKFTDHKHIGQLQNSIGNEEAWTRNYLLALEPQRVLHVPQSIIDKYELGQTANKIIDCRNEFVKNFIPRGRADYKISAPITQENYTLFIIPES